MASLARDNPLRRAARKIQAVSAFQDALRRRVAGHAGAEAAPPPALELNATTSASAPIRTSTTAEAVVGTYDEVFDFFADLPIRTTAPDDLPRVARGDLPSKRDNVCRAMVERGYIVVSLSDEDAELVAKARAMEDVGFSFQRLLYRPGIHPCIHTHVHTCTCTLGPKLLPSPPGNGKDICSYMFVTHPCTLRRTHPRTILRPLAPLGLLASSPLRRLSSARRRTSRKQWRCGATSWGGTAEVMSPSSSGHAWTATSRGRLWRVSARRLWRTTRRLETERGLDCA